MSGIQRKSNGDPALKAEATHHVDSAFGALLVAVVFLSNIVIAGFQKYPGKPTDELIISLALLVTVSILTGFAGILAQSFLLRLFGWFFVFLLLLAEVVSLGLVLLSRVAGVIVALWGILVLGWVISVTSSVLALYAVTDAYCRRLSSVSCRDDELTELRSMRKQLVFTEVFTVPITLLLLFFILT